MSSADWQLDPAELASKFSERTKAIVLNSPNNPLGKVTPLASLWAPQGQLGCYSSPRHGVVWHQLHLPGTQVCSAGVLKPNLVCQQCFCPVLAQEMVQPRVRSRVQKCSCCL